MGCYPSRTDVTTMSGSQEALSPQASPTPVAGCCAIGVKGQSASNTNKGENQATKPTDNGWVNGDSKATPGEPGASPNAAETKPPVPDIEGKENQDPDAPSGSLPGALGEEEAATTSSQPVVEKQELEPKPEITEVPSASAETPSKYRAFVPVRGEYVPVAAAVEGQGDIDFEAEKQKIEAQFCALEKALDEGTMERSEIERQFEALTNQAARLRRLQAAAQSAPPAPASASASDSAAAKPPVKLVPTAPPAQLAPLVPKTLAPIAATEGAGATPTMAVVHWKGVTKKKFVVYRDAIVEKYGDGPEGIKSIERIPNRILITVPVAEVMLKILADETLDPRPEPYRLPGGNNAPKPASGLSKPGALQANASSLLAPPDGLAPLRSPSSQASVRTASPFAR